MADLIDRQALRLMKTEECAGHSIEYAMGWKACIEWIRAMPSAQPEKCSDILDELKADDYYNYIHTGYSRFSEDDWDYLIHNAKEKEELHERLDIKAGGD